MGRLNDPLFTGKDKYIEFNIFNCTSNIETYHIEYRKVIVYDESEASSNQMGAIDRRRPRRNLHL